MVPVEEPAPPFVQTEAPKPNFIELAVEGIKRVGSGTFDGAMAIGAATVNGVKFAGGGVGAGFLAVFGEGIDKTDSGLEAAFAKMDSDKNGKIDAAEMKAYILSVYDKELDLKIIDEMMTADTNKNGEIDLAEFKVIMRAGPKKSDGAVVEGAKVVGTATVNGAKATGGLVVTGLQKTGVTAGFQAVFGKGIDKSDAGLEASFVKVDTDKSGKINHEEMKAYIQSVYEKGVDDKTIGEMMAAADTNKDGEIDLAEFKVIMRAGPKKAADGAIGGAVDAGIGATVGGVKTLGDGAVFVGKATVRGVKATGGFVVIGLEKTFDTLGVTQGFQAAFAEDIDKSDAGLEASFVKVDTDKSGKINAEEMKAYILSVYPKGLDNRKIAQMMAAADTNKDGEIDLAEFKVIMRAGPPVGAIDNFLNMCMHPPREIEE
jgi:Ca2+-binding EF-hand superfamily protein